MPSIFPCEVTTISTVRFSSFTLTPLLLHRSPSHHTQGGSLYHYPHFNPQLDFAQLHNDLRWNLTRPQGLEAVARLRVSNGLSVGDYQGAFFKRTQTDVDLPAVDSDKTIFVTLKHEDKLVDNGEACLQFAMLYSTTGGQRRIRVHTLTVSTASTLANAFRAADLDVILSYEARKAALRVLEGKDSLTAIKDKVVADSVNALYAYRRFCATNSSAGQLILPEALKLLPLYTLGLLKSNGLRADVPSDERCAWAFRMAALPTHLTVPTVYPRLYPVAALELPISAESVVPPPPTTWLSSEKLDAEGVYLLVSSTDMYVWVGRQAQQQVLQELFGAESVDQLTSAQPLPPPKSAQAEQLLALINSQRAQFASYMRMRVLKRPDPLEHLFFNSLIEDRSGAGMSYVEFLCQVHRQIQAKFV